MDFIYWEISIPGNMPYCLSSPQSTFSLYIGKNNVFQNVIIKKLIDDCRIGNAPSCSNEISLVYFKVLILSVLLRNIRIPHAS